MRLFYATAAALAPLLFAAGAQAQVVINTARTTPVQTANANNGAAADVQIASGGAINVTSGTAVTINSDNDFTIAAGGSVAMTNSADGSTGVLVTAGSDTAIILNDDVVVTDALTTYPNADNDLDPDGPWATGSGRYGLRVSGPASGSILISRTGGVAVEGNDSFALSIDDGFTGNLRSQGEIRALGDRSIALRSAGTLTGNAWLGGIINAVGEGATAVRFDGAVTGSLNFQADVQATGFRYTARPPADALEDVDADDRLIGGPAVRLGADVAGGVLFDTTPEETNANSTDDDGDGVTDSEETASRVSSFGSAPAILVGSDTQSVTLGAVGTGALNYGLINRGSVTGQGVLDGIDAQGILIGGGAQPVVIEGGVLNAGTITTLSYEGDSRAVTFGSGATTPRFDNATTISAVSSSEAGGEVNAVLIEAGASVGELTNRGRMQAASVGGTATVGAVVDRSGTLTSVTNMGTVEATIAANEDGDAITGTATAFDLRANTTGVTFVQDDDPAIAPPTGSVPDSDGDGVRDSAEPAITGDVLFGSGADQFLVRNGTVNGAIDFGAGADSLVITGGATVRGALRDSDGLLDIDVQNGVLDNQRSEALNVSDLSVGSQGVLIFTVDGATDQAGTYNVGGTATLADGAEFGVRFTSLIEGPERYTVIDATTLNAGAIDFDATEENTSYLFRVEGGVDAAAGQVYLDVRRRTAEEAGLSASETSLYDSFYGALDEDDALLAAFISQTSREEFLDLYEQMLPEHSGGPLLSLSGGVDAVTRALVGRNASAAPGRASAWMQEITFYADKDKGDTYGFRSEGFGVAGGVEMGSTYGNLGVSLAFTSSDLEDPESEAEEVVSASLIELGLYWRAQGQYWTTWARAAGGYATFESTRRLVGSGLNLSNSSSWNGWTVAVAGGASYERDFGRLTIRPEIYAEYFSLSEDAHVEAGGGPGFDLELNEREGHMFSATAAMNVGLNLGQGNWLKPEIRLGWRQNISVDPGVTMGRFVGSTGPDFAITPDGLEGGGPIAGVRLNVGNELGMLSISADAEMIDDYVRYMLLLRASFRF